MDTLIPALNKLFVGRIEQVRPSDLEIAVKRKISDDEHWAYHNAGVYKFNYSMIYSYNRKAVPPDTITARELTDLEQRAKIKPQRAKKSRPVVGREKATALAAQNGIDIAKYAHLDNGRLAMTVNNLLRGREKKGLPVTWLPNEGSLRSIKESHD